MNLPTERAQALEACRAVQTQTGKNRCQISFRSTRKQIRHRFARARQLRLEPIFTCLRLFYQRNRFPGEPPPAFACQVEGETGLNAAHLACSCAADPRGELPWTRKSR